MNLGPDQDFRLSDRYTTETGEVLVTGIQALVRIPYDQMRVDRANGHNTAVFVSGYQGSPLGGLDREIAAQTELNKKYGVVHRPGLNEDLAATAVSGSQLVSTLKSSNRDGVVGIWYGKGPGLDRSLDAMRHANFAGTSRFGGVLALVGDDPACKSSTLPSRCDPAIQSLAMPLLDPGTMQDVLDLGRHGVALSRASGLWTAMKIITPVADGTGLAHIDPNRLTPIIPTLEWGGREWNPTLSAFTTVPHSLGQEAELFGPRNEMALKYIVANKLNECIVNPPSAWLGIVASGYNAELVLKTLRTLGIDEERAASLGIRILKLRAVLPFDGDAVREFARDLSTVMVVEEKRSFIETLVRDALYSLANRPHIVGKKDTTGAVLVPIGSALSIETIAEPLRRVLVERIPSDQLESVRQRRPLALTINADAVRGPYFCSGCPHNTSTVVPEGSLVGLGIGCHGMVEGVRNGERGEFTGITQMGGEGLHWVGMAPFSDADHIFQNIGDGTFFHSGQLALQAAIASGESMTYKILYNAAVAMTGGQDATGLLTVPQVAAKVRAEGVKEVIITTDNVEKYRGMSLAAGVTVRHRDDLVAAQEHLRTIKGVTVLIHDQQCAAEKRRDRKRGILEIPKERIVIDERVCEGCGDCGVQSNCLSLEPIDTEFGRKTRIDQASCNVDTSCLKGDCPAFVTVKLSDTKSGSGRAGKLVGPGAGLGKKKTRVAMLTTPLVEPTRVVPAHGLTIRMPGIGGTGVITISQMLLTAAKIEGLHASAVDQTGLAQKGGPVLSTLSIGSPTPGRVEALIAFDILSAVTAPNVEGLDPEWSHLVANTHVTPTGRMVGRVATASLDVSGHRTELASRASAEFLNASELAIGLLGNALTSNVLLLGVAYQRGLLPLRAESIQRAIELNGVAVDANLAAFEWGRRWVTDRASVEAASHQGHAVSTDRSGLNDLGWEPVIASVAVRREELTAYQDSKYADQFVQFVRKVADAERVAGGDGSFSTVVAHQLHKVMAYKDEYEVARLLLDGGRERIEESYGASVESLTWNLHPPMLRAAGMDKKLKLGPSLKPALAALKPMKKLRGTKLDLFGYAEVRREERALISEYRSLIESLLPTLATDPVHATHVAGLIDQVRGFEGVKMRNLKAYRTALAEAIAR